MIAKIFFNNKLVYFTLISFFILFGRLFWSVNSRLPSRRVDTALCFSVIFSILSYKKYERYLIGKGST